MSDKTAGLDALWREAEVEHWTNDETLAAVLNFLVEEMDRDRTLEERFRRYLEYGRAASEV